MKVRDYFPPVLVRAASAVVRSLASDFARGRDLEESTPTVNRMVEPYRQSAWVHAAINLIVGELARAELKFYAGDTEFADPAFVAWWAAPAFGPPTVLESDRGRLPVADVVRDLAAWAKLEGEFFLLFDDLWLLTAGRRLGKGPALPPFVIARPSAMQGIYEGGRLAGWRYTDAGGRQLTLVPQQVVHWRGWNPYDDFRGVGSLQAAQTAAESAFYTGTFIREMMRNNGDQGFIVAAKHGVAGPEQREQIVADLRAKRAALRRGVARDLFVDTDITVDRPPQQAAGADLAATKVQSQEEVFVAFGVPPSMAQAKSNFSMGKDSDRYQLITGTCQPLGFGIAGALAQVATRLAGQPLRAELDWDDHPVMIEVRNSRIDAALKLWAAGMPLQESNQYLGLGMKPFVGWEVGYLPFSVQPVSGEAAPMRDPAPANDPALAEPVDPALADPQVQALRLLLLARQRVCRRVQPVAAPVTREAFAAFACECAAEHGALAAKHEGEPVALTQRSLWESHMAKRRPTLKSFQSAFGRLLMQARTETLRKIDALAAKSLAAPVEKVLAADLIFDLAKFALEFRSTMEKQHTQAVQTSGQQLLAELKLDDPFQAPPAEVLAFVRARQNKLSGVPDEVHARIKASLEAGLASGESTAQLAARVRAEFNAIDDGRSRVIASTETAAAYGAGRAQAMAQAGVQWKAWLTSGNGNVRAAHFEAGFDYRPENAIPIDEPFIVGGERLMHPGDPSGSPANTINCHCVSIAVANGPTETAA